MGKTLLAESVGQRLLVISTALAPFRVVHYATKVLATTNVLYKSPTNRCKNQHKRSTDPRCHLSRYILLLPKTHLLWSLYEIGY
ncbi:hypothetical protein Q4519_06545 [Motilimonas sp. 1_MG-2023]|nr:hypothetical protein [Motilimonas sp. 1_MG-2023]MDO6525341.1 hypothetical protein [Motilimonas sp. 1_MG-2023]